MLPGRPLADEVRVRDQHARRVRVRAKHADRLARLHEQRLVVLELLERATMRRTLPVARGLAGAAVDDEILGSLGDVRIEVVLEHAQRGFLHPALAGEARCRSADGSPGAMARNCAFERRRVNHTELRHDPGAKSNVGSRPTDWSEARRGARARGLLRRPRLGRARACDGGAARSAAGGPGPRRSRDAPSFARRCALCGEARPSSVRGARSIACLPESDAEAELRRVRYGALRGSARDARGAELVMTAHTETIKRRRC